jgi:hypothetical protein
MSWMTTGHAKDSVRRHPSPVVFFPTSLANADQATCGAARSRPGSRRASPDRSPRWKQLFQRTAVLRSQRRRGWLHARRIEARVLSNIASSPATANRDFPQRTGVRQGADMTFERCTGDMAYLPIVISWNVSECARGSPNANSASGSCRASSCGIGCALLVGFRLPSQALATGHGAIRLVSIRTDCV